MNSNSDPFPPTMAPIDSPHIFDTDMADGVQGEGVFFENALPSESPGFFSDNYLNSHYESPMPVKIRKINADSHGIRGGATLSASPESSVQDDSSDSSGMHKRKNSSRSSHSAPSQKAAVIPFAERQTWNVKTEPNLDFRSTPAYPNFMLDNSNSMMEHDFDFDTAANTPSPAMSGNSGSDTATNRHVAISYGESPIPPTGRVHQSSSSTTGTRETSPLSAMTNGDYPVHSFPQSRTSPASSNEEFIDGGMLGGIKHFSPFPNLTPRAFPDALSIPSSRPGSLAVQGTVPVFPKPLPSSLIIHPTPHKSRVETQIAIKISLYPVPEGVTKLHLPTHTISKPKLLAKPMPEKSPDMLELSTMLVCYSAMQDPTRLQRAFKRAATQSSPNIKREKRRSSAGDAKSDDESLPLNGGEVNICDGCIVRERKRAARKKSKKPEEEEPWQRDEAKRIIVFNTNEVKDWQEPSLSENQIDGSNSHRENRINIPEGAQQIDLPMRIACYCRHQNEKLGFQVIFTVKDHEDRLIAQTITDPIVITDDHKTHAAPSLSGPGSSFSDQNQINGSTMFARDSVEHCGTGLYRNAHSTNDLASLQQGFNSQFAMQPMAFAAPQPPSHNTSTSLTPRNLSRQASPTAPGLKIHKKRKASSGQIKVPGALQMTQMRLDTSAPGAVTQQWQNSSPFTLSPTAPSSFAPAFPNIPGPRHASQRSAQFYSGPPTPSHEQASFFGRSQSFENLTSAQQMFPITHSAHASRAPSPTSAQVMNTSNSSMPQGSLAATFSPTTSIGGSLTQRPPTINKLIPNEGPKAGGIEVTCLGSGFRQGLEVMFGDSLATTTTYWGETSLVCLLPPALSAGTVPVTFKHQYQHRTAGPRFNSQTMSKHQAIFKYVDDDEQELFKQAVIMVHQKMYGTVLDGGDMARNLLGLNSSNPLRGAWPGVSMGSEQHMQRASTLTNSESLVLRCLDFIDQDESPFPARLNIRRSRNGQTILHVAASLGFTRLVAGLLARGANPDVRDRNGMSPMHMAALNGHAQIVRKLRLAGGDAMLRSLRGFVPADMVTSQPVMDEVQMLPHVSTAVQSVNQIGWTSRPGSSTSLVSLGRTQSWETCENSNSSDSDGDDTLGIRRPRSRGQRTPARQWVRSRRNSASTEQTLAVPPLAQATDLATPGAAMAAWRDHLAAQIHQFQQSVHWSFPQLQMPAMPALPNLPDYQAYPMVRRFSSLVPQRNSQAPSDSGSSSGSNASDTKEGWWDRLTLRSPPPAYEEIYPEQRQRDSEAKQASAVLAATDAAADQKCAAQFDSKGESSVSAAAAASSSTTVKQVKFSKAMSAEDYEELQRAHAKNFTKLRHDRNLWSIWIPLLLVVIVAVMVRRVPIIWYHTSAALEYAQKRYNNLDRTVDALRDIF